MLVKALPASFAAGGYVTAAKIRPHRRLMLGTEGASDSGKSEFALSAPGPGICLCLDRGYEAMLDNKTPPPTRRDDFVFKVIRVPLASTQTQTQYLEYWRAFYSEWIKALDNKDARTVILDGDSDSWDLQRLAEFGKLTQIPSILYTSVNTGRRAMIARGFDSGKTIIATNRLKKGYRTKYKADGTPEKDGTGKDLREWDGKLWDRQGFEDQEYLWQVQLRHLYDPIKKIWGIRILKCKSDKDLIGMELWGEYCNFPSLVQTIHPDVPLSEWGY